jgi:acylphosphatase
MTSQQVKSVHVFVSGRVQGVTYRASTQRAALQHGVTGWVRNRRDRRVEARFEGPPADVDALLAWCHDGPELARVTDVEVTVVPAEGFDGFTVERTV